MVWERGLGWAKQSDIFTTLLHSILTTKLAGLTVHLMALFYVTSYECEVNVWRQLPHEKWSHNLFRIHCGIVMLTCICALWRWLTCHAAKVIASPLYSLELGECLTHAILECMFPQFLCRISWTQINCDNGQILNLSCNNCCSVDGEQRSMVPISS